MITQNNWTKDNRNSRNQILHDTRDGSGITSFGHNNDDVIEIYINPTSWMGFNRAQKYFLMYHELSHDVLNLDDLNADESNKGRLMFPNIESYDKISMDEFIESYQNVFEEVTSE